MSVIFSSPWDPLFWTHHAYVDRLFAWWQEYHTWFTGVDTSTCAVCSQLMTFYGVPADEWLGRWDTQQNCYAVPKSSPQSCISYASASNGGLSALQQANRTSGPHRFGLLQSELALVEKLPVRCAESLRNLSMGMCSAEALHKQLRHTCRVKKQGMTNACTELVKTIPEGAISADDKHRRLARCGHIAEDEVAREEEEGYVQPEDAAEETLCFSCRNVVCDGKSGVSGQKSQA